MLLEECSFQLRNMPIATHPLLHAHILHTHAHTHTRPAITAANASHHTHVATRPGPHTKRTYSAYVNVQQAKTRLLDPLRCHLGNVTDVAGHEEEGTFRVVQGPTSEVSREAEIRVSIRDEKPTKELCYPVCGKPSNQKWYSKCRSSLPHCPRPTPTIIDAWHTALKVNQSREVADAQILCHIHIIGLHKLNANFICLIINCLEFSQHCLACWAVVVI
ncbi:hypothetical protein E2C01_007839 [Portunus trituberculatus]|uniref:Uncharacterized protein n=1 Tax=Portunus trituberculatus TaxID=210409 RepID=A0A5B7D3F6_PORTR|nr:hypothetical protein [Portunus trituberculatus]